MTSNVREQPSVGVRSGWKCIFFSRISSVINTGNPIVCCSVNWASRDHESNTKDMNLPGLVCARFFTCATPEIDPLSWSHKPCASSLIIQCFCLWSGATAHIVTARVMANATIAHSFHFSQIINSWIRVQRKIIFNICVFAWFRCHPFAFVVNQNNEFDPAITQTLKATTVRNGASE